MSITQSVEARPKRLPARRILLTLSPILLIALIGGSLLGVAARVPAGHIAPGVRVGDVSLGGMSRDEASAALASLVLKKQTVVLALRFPASTGIKHVWRPDAAKLGLSIDPQATLAAAAQAGQTGVLANATRLVTGSRQTPVAPRVRVDAQKLRAYLKHQIARDINRPARNAKLILLPQGGHKVTPDKTGVQVDIETSADLIAKAWTAYNAADAPKTGAEPTPDAPGQTAPDSGAKPSTSDKKQNADLTIELAAKTTRPAITAAALQGLSEMGGFSTRFGGTGASRGKNIALATRHINGTILAPGEIFSYNKVVGPRIESAGFQDAPVIVRGELVPGIGGGICQVSSTLYNAVLLSDLKIVHRSHHAFPVHYLPAGRDATVVDGAIDFKFQNSSGGPIYIAASSSRGLLSFRILGKRKPGKSVSIVLANHTVEPAPGAKTIRDATLPAGRRKVKDRGHSGHRVDVYRVVRENGQVTKKELISHDHYRPFPPTILVGTKAVRPKAKPAAKPKTASPAPAPAPPVAPPN